jgi:hypothetical protein
LRKASMCLSRGGMGCKARANVVRPRERNNKLITHASAVDLHLKKNVLPSSCAPCGYLHALFGFAMWPVLNNAISGGWMLILLKICLELRHPGQILCGRGRLANSRVAAQDAPNAPGQLVKHPHFYSAAPSLYLRSTAVFNIWQYNPDNTF